MPREFSMVTAKGSVRKSLACWWGERARILTRIMETILSRADAAENTTLRVNAYLEGVSSLVAGGRPAYTIKPVGPEPHFSPGRRANNAAAGPKSEKAQSRSRSQLQRR